MKIRIKIIITIIISAAIVAVAGIMLAAAWRTHQNHSYFVNIEKDEKIVCRQNGIGNK